MFPFSRFSPAIQEMCRLEFPRRAQLLTTAPIDYHTRFSLRSEDIPDLLEIAGWLGRELEIAKTVADCWDAPLHAWEALTIFEPIQVVPPMLDLLNRLEWTYADEDFLQNVLGDLGKRSAEESQETGNASQNTIPLFLAALKEKERHSTTRMVLCLAVNYMTHRFPEHRSEFLQFLEDDLEELRIDCRDWYAEIVCELAFTENPSPELATLMNKACREGYAETCRYWENDGLIENFGFDFENDEELLALHAKSEDAHSILWDFEQCENRFPHHAVQKARELRDWIIPNLIEVIRDATAYARFHVDNDDGTHQFAVHLLAEFQAKEALPAIFDSLSLTTDEIWDYLYGDGLFESMPGILNRLIGDEPEFYDQKLRDPQTPTALKICLSEALRYVVARKVISVETYGSWLRDYLELAIQSENVEVVTDIVCDILDTANPDYIPIVRSAFEKELVDEGMIGLKYAIKELTTRSFPLEKVLPNPNRDFSDTVKELSKWAWFNKPPRRPAQPSIPLPPSIDFSRALFGDLLSTSTKPSFAEDDYFDDEYDDGIPEPLKTDHKVGRNEPCPCGSGKKYKVCCLKKS